MSLYPLAIQFNKIWKFDQGMVSYFKHLKKVLPQLLHLHSVINMHPGELEINLSSVSFRSFFQIEGDILNNCFSIQKYVLSAS